MVDAFLEAARAGDLDALMAVLDPDVVLRIDAGPQRPNSSTVVHVAPAVAHQAKIGLRRTSGPGGQRGAAVNGAAGLVVTSSGQPVAVAVMGFTIHGRRIAEIDAVADCVRVLAPSFVAGL